MFGSQGSDKIEMYNIFKVIVILFGLTLLYNHYKSCLMQPRTVRIFVKDPKFTTLNPYNNTVYEVDDGYNQLIDIKNFTFIINPKTCDSYENSGLLLLVIVSSKPDNLNKRSLIRNTWGHQRPAMQLVFLMGETENATIKENIMNESSLNGDIVQGNFKDAYRNMTYKHVMGLKWISHHCPRAKYVLKTDDDIVVNSHELWHFLIRELSPWGAKDLIMCSVFQNALVQRDKSGKWRVTEEEYSGRHYPTYCAGWAILYSADVIPRLLSVAQSISYFWIDDVHITGVIAEKIKVVRTPLSTLILNSNQMKLLTLCGPSEVGQFLFGPPQLTTDKINEIWKSIPQ